MVVAAMSLGRVFGASPADDRPPGLAAAARTRPGTALDTTEEVAR